jgi:recombination endonuclease VII
LEDAVPKLPCATCGHEDRATGRTKCHECWLASQAIPVRQKDAEWRLSAIPEPLRLSRVAKEDWPTGRRWCSGCQSFVRLADVPKKGSRCKTCTGIAAHGGMVERVYNLSAKEYGRIFRAQDGRCAICLGIPRTVRLAVDHDHKTGEVRGLLCSRCNHELLGAAHDSVNILRRAVKYLEKPPAYKALE